MHISHSKNGKTEVRLMRRTFQVRIGYFTFNLAPPILDSTCNFSLSTI
jgi:hypothetical protein